MRFLYPFLSRTRCLSRDDGGAVLLLSAMMIFLVAIFGMITMNTNKAVYNRVVTQNAVDSAADAAALWQARGCNLLQHLNNIHHDADVVFYTLEAASLATCIIAPFYPVFCASCSLAPVWDATQEGFVGVLMPLQEAIADATPIVAFIYANAAAAGSGADPVLSVGVDYVGDFLARFGLSGSIGGASDTVSTMLGSIPIYAVPLDPASLSLYVERKKGKKAPWHFAKWLTYVPRGAAKACPSFIDDLPEEWGWDDDYFYGNPGWMTWVAGKVHQHELLDLGDLRWFNGGREASGNVRSAMYSGPARGNGLLQIPAFLGIASSQVEGEPVVSYGEADARGRLINTHLPYSGSSLAPVIYH